MSLSRKTILKNGASTTANEIVRLSTTNITSWTAFPASSFAAPRCRGCDRKRQLFHVPGWRPGEWDFRRTNLQRHPCRAHRDTHAQCQRGRAAPASISRRPAFSQNATKYVAESVENWTRRYRELAEKMHVLSTARSREVADAVRAPIRTEKKEDTRC